MRLSRYKLNLTASALALFATSSGGAALANALPSNGTVAAGNASIAGTASTLTVNQSSANAVINWQSFNVGAGDKVVFVQPTVNSATLNRVTGNTTSVIAGDITATGTVYLINPNGIQITSTGAISVGRGFVASTLDLADKDFLAGKGTFSGTGGSIGNAGSITTASGGFVGLLGGSVATSGRILAPAGRVVIGAGTVATLDINGGGFLQVALPSGAALSADGSAALVSGGAARDAVRNMVNLPASVNAQSLSGRSGSIDLGGSISVDSASGNAGHIKVLGDSLSGNATLSARATGATGDGGHIETSGNTVDFSGFSITTAATHGKTGTWLLDPLDLTIDAAGATSLSNALATNSVILTTSGANDTTGTSSATGSSTAISPSSYGTASTGSGNINITSAVSWNSANSLTLQAYNNIAISAPITALTGSLVLTAGNGVSQTGTVTATAAVNVGMFSLTNGNWMQNSASLPSFSATDFSFDTNSASFLRVTGGAGSAGSPYQISDVYGLQGINSAALLASSFVVTGNISASGTSAWNAGAGFLPIGTDASDTIVAGTGFTGSLDGQGHTINGLTINLPSADNVGLFGAIGSGGVVQNLGVTAVSITANSNLGGLAGENQGTITNSYSTGTINENGAGFAGGLVGQNFGTIGGSNSSAVVKGSDVIGGLVGSNANMSTITGSFATGAVTQSGTVGDGGGLAGQNYGTITDSYATGAVRGGTSVGGLVGFNAGGAKILGSHATGQVFGNDPTNGIAGGLVGDNGGAIANDAAGASYATGAVSGTINVGGLVGQVDASGTVIGAYATGKTTGTASNVGGLAGNSDGSISQSYASGAVQGANFVGGLVGANYHSISDTYATGAVTSGALKGLANAGGLVGQNAPLPGNVAATITTSYATGAVKSTVSTATALGGLVGSNLGTVTASFFNTQTTGRTDTNGGTGVTTAAMQNLATFTGAGWAIDDAGGTTNTWRIYNSSTTPLLRIFLAPLTITGNSATITYDGNAHSVSGYTVPANANSAEILGTATNPNVTGTNAGTYTAALTGLYSNQQGYDLNLVPVSLTISGAQLTAITAGLIGTTTKAYDGTTVATLTSGNYQLSGFVNGQGATVNQTVGTYGSVNAGSGIAVTASLSNSNFVPNSGTNLSNYMLPTSATGMIGVITPAALSVTATAQTRTYGATNPALTYSQTGLVGNDTLTGSLATVATSGSNVGTYAITQGSLAASSNYTLSYTGANLGVTPASLTVTYNAAAASSTYGTTPSGLTGTVSATGLVNNDTVGGVTSGTAAWATPATSASNVGTYAINGAGLSAASSNYNVTFAQNAANAAALTINPASLTVTYNAAAASSVYGTTPSGLTGTVSATGLVNNDTVGSVTSGTAAWTTPATSSSNVGMYAINGSGLQGASGNYTIAFAQGTGNATALTITQAQLTAITAALTGTATKTYDGTTIATLTSGNYQLSGFVNGQGATVNQTVGTYGSANAGSGIAVTANLSNANFVANSGTNLSNYALPNSATGMIGVITPASLTVTASGQTRTYGAANPALTYSETGLVNGDTLTGSLATTATSASNVGTYAISQGSLGASSNYTLSYIGANLGVTPASLTVTYNAAAASSVYGTTPSGLTGTVSAAGLVNNDSLGGVTSGTAAWTTPATSTSNVGTYAINGSGLIGASGNYNVAFAQNPGNASALTITKAPLIAVTAGLTGTISKTYDGTTVATLTSGNYQLSGFANGQGAVVNQTVGTYGSANAGSGIAVTANLSNANFVANSGTNLSNYALPNSATGMIGVITPASLSVTATAQTRTYGAANPALTYSETGLVNGDTLTGSLTTTATAASNVGTYAITQGSLAASSNYTLSYTGANLGVTPASLTVTYNAAAASSTYGTTPSGLTGTVSATGLVNNDTVGGVTSGTAAWATPATSKSNVGTYAINGSGLSGASGNYNVTFAQGAGNATALKVNPATLTVTYTANAASSTYGTTPAGLSGSVGETGLVNGDTAGNVVGGTANWSTTASGTSNVGTYGISGSGIATTSANYTINSVQAAANASALTINPASLSVTASGQTRTYGAANPALTYSETGLVNGDTLTGSLTTTATAASNVGTYAITQGSLAASSNYTLSYTGANLGVTPASLTVTYNAAAASSTYGTTPSGLTGTVSATGLVNNDTVGGVTSGTAAWATPATSTSNVGTYAINGSGLSGASGNYNVTFAQGAGNATALKVNPATLTVTYTANAASSTYGTTPAGLSGSVGETGLVNGDTAGNVVGGTANWSTTANGTSNVGTYGISGSGIASTSANYTVNSVQAAANASALTINPASLSVTASGQTRTYGAANPALTYSETGLVNGDTLTGSLATTATSASNVGTYAITQGSLGASSNYTLRYTGANLAVTPASLTVTYVATPVTIAPGAPLPALTGSISANGLVNNDTIKGVTGGTAVWTTTALSGSNPGVFPIVGSGLTAASGNYTFTFNQAPGNAKALLIAQPAAAQFGSNSLPRMAPGADGSMTASDSQAIYGNNNVSQLDLDTGITTTACAPGARCPARN
ncbi:MBG domain-containing protein [Novosphingobium sp.]|uniref:MBG domain-containing protein n=1 Tax=Novosphingobium sp. TaxID=1874826 RepID=UPI003B5287DD